MLAGGLMTTQTRAIAVASAIVLTASDSYAQASDETSILRVAAQAVRQHLPKGPTAVDPRVGVPGHQYRYRVAGADTVAQHTPAMLAVIAAGLSGNAARIEDVYSCDADAAGDCRLHGYAAAVAFG